MKRKHKKFSRPRKPFDAERIKSENEIVKKYGLKNKREIWKAKAKLDIIRKQAKKTIHLDEEKQKKFLGKLAKMGLKTENVVDVLAFTEEDILKRRLQSIIVKGGLATTPKGARQSIVHKHVLIKGDVVNIPSYWVNTSEESSIKLNIKHKKAKPAGEINEVQKHQEAIKV